MLMDSMATSPGRPTESPGHTEEGGHFIKVSVYKVDTNTFIMCVNPTKEHGTKTKNTMQYTRLAKTLKHLVPSVILWLHPRHTEGPRQGGQPGATATSLQQSPTNTRSKPHCRWWHHWTLIPLSQVRD